MARRQTLEIDYAIHGIAGEAACLPDGDRAHEIARAGAQRRYNGSARPSGRHEAISRKIIKWAAITWPWSVDADPRPTCRSRPQRPRPARAHARSSLEST